MKKSVRIAVGLAVVAGVASTAGAWYTGQQLPASLASAISNANSELKTVTPGLGVDVQLELLSLETGLFSSTAHYRIKAKGDLTTAGDETKAIDDELLFVDRIEHGPFPLSRLMRLQLMPVMTKNTIELENSPLVAPWFAVTKGLSPITAQASIGYTGSVSSTLKLQAVDFNKDGASLKFSGLDINAKVGAGQQSFKVDGAMDSLVLVGNDQSQIELHGLSLLNDSTMGASGLYLGSSESQLKQVQVRLPSQPPLLINNLRQTGQLAEGKTGVFGSFTSAIGMLNVAGKDLGSLELAGSVKDLDTQALKQLSDLYKALVSHLDAADYDASNPDLNLSAEQKTQLEAIIGNLLAGKPVFALDKLALKTANGETSFNLSLGLNKPSAFDLPPDVLAMQTIASLDAQLLVSKSMIKDVVMSQAALDPSVDPAMAKQQAEQMSEMAGMMAVGTQMAAVDGDNIVARFKYAEGQVELNGRKMPLEEFMAMGMGMAGGMGGGMPPAGGMNDSAPDYSAEPAEEAASE
ncbi:MAG: YdgA family protein [Pseudomonadaceae bacterium]|jgi:uncharacterized protein YdgA (DUF945 family)|nr:YdgA family protein [Pseudomonadaceae bacterium]